jgi:hypothetical protein
MFEFFKRKGYAELLRERDDARAQLASLMDPEIKDLRMENGAFDLALGGAIVKHLALVITEWFRATKEAENYVEMVLTAKDDPFETYAVTVQKVDGGNGSPGKTPHQFRQEAEDNLAAMTVKYQDLVKFYDSQVGTPCEEIRHNQQLAEIRDTLLPFIRRDQEIDDWYKLDSLMTKIKWPKVELRGE